MNCKTLGTSAAAALFLSTAVPVARADVLTPDDTLRVEFTINNNWAGVTPDVISMNFGLIQVLSSYTARTARIYNGTNLLGTDTKTSFGGYTGMTGLRTWCGWRVCA